MKTGKTPIQGITNPAIRRLAHKGGVKTMSNSIYDIVRGILAEHVTKLVESSITFSDYSRKKTVQERDVREALEVLGRPAAFADGKQKTRRFEKTVTDSEGNTATKFAKRVVKEYDGSRTTNCNSYNKLQNKKKSPQVGAGEIYDENDYDTYNPEEDDLDGYDYDLDDAFIDNDSDNFQEGGAKKAPGVVSLKQIKHYQKQSGHCFNLPKLSFQRLIRGIAQDFEDHRRFSPDAIMRFSPDAIMMIQLDTEIYIVNLFSDALLHTIHAKRVRVQGKDISMAIKMRK